MSFEETLSQNELELLREAANNHNMQLREDYSGRSMYGALCVGFVYDDLGDFLSALVDIAIDDYDFASTLASRACTDSMGLSTIVYFPRLTVSQES